MIKKLGDNGLLGPTREVEYGGLGLDYSYSMAIAEELGNIRCMGIPMAIGVHTGIPTHTYPAIATGCFALVIVKLANKHIFCTCMYYSQLVS